MSIQIGEGIPGGEDVLGAVNDVVRQWTEPPTPASWAVVETARPSADGLYGGIRRLTLINCYQWGLENHSRAHYADPQRLAEVKREIDASNARRTSQIDQLNDAFVGVLVEARGAALEGSPSLATPAEVVDRLSILALRRRHLAARTERTQVEPGVEMVERQIADLATAFDELMGEVIAGRRRLDLYRTVKLYG